MVVEVRQGGGGETGGGMVVWWVEGRWKDYCAEVDVVMLSLCGAFRIKHTVSFTRLFLPGGIAV